MEGSVDLVACDNDIGSIDAAQQKKEQNRYGDHGGNHKTSLQGSYHSVTSRVYPTLRLAMMATLAFRAASRLRR